MEILLPLIILFVPISILAKQVCLAPSGCKIEMDTGLCPKCIFEKDEPSSMWFPVYNLSKIFSFELVSITIHKPSPLVVQIMKK